MNNNTLMNRFLHLIEGKLDNDGIQNLRKETDKILEEKLHPTNQELAGNLEYQYAMTQEGIDIFKPVIFEHLYRYHGHYEWKLTGSWVNFQRKHEFNPIHNHSGDFSFVLWLTIPFNLNDEMSLPSVRESNSPAASIFNLLYADPFGAISTRPFFLDKKDSGKFVIFKSTMPHLVYPFYTSDEYRVSISGNIISTKAER